VNSHRFLGQIGQIDPDHLWRWSEPAMPRTARASAANVCYHALNRGNHRAAVFHKDADFRAFVDLLAEASLRHPMRLLAYCLSTRRDAPFGSEPWVLRTAAALGLESSFGTEAIPG
jgi:putative transposase